MCIGCSEKGCQALIYTVFMVTLASCFLHGFSFWPIGQAGLKEKNVNVLISVLLIVNKN